MSPFKKCILSSQQAFYRSLYLNPLSDSPEHPLPSFPATLPSAPCVHMRSSSHGSSSPARANAVAHYKENDPPEAAFPVKGSGGKESGPNAQRSLLRNREPLRPVARRPSSAAASSSCSSSARSCDTQIKSVRRSNIVVVEEEEELQGGVEQETAPLFPPPTPTHLSHVWDDPGCEAAPASAWSTLGNRTLLCRPLPLDVGRCVCYISLERLDGCSIYSLYTDEGYGRQDRRLAVARHRRRTGRSEFLVFSAAAAAADKASSDALTVVGRLQSNLIGSRYSIWDEVDSAASSNSKSRRQLLGVVMFEPTISTLTGTFRVMRVSIPKHQSMLMSSSNQQERSGLPLDWEENYLANVHRLHSRKPYYNKGSRRYELDFRDRAKRSCRIKTSSKNLQLTMDENGKQAILMLGKIGKSKYVMEYRFPLTGQQAFAICLASMDSKLCCSL